MTKQHPLTDKICSQIIGDWVIHTYDGDIMRAAADWQLEQVIEWFSKTRTGYLVQDLEIRSNLQPDDDDDVLFITDLKEAMRPQQQENN